MTGDGREMISEKLLSILVCPETKQALKLAEQSVVEQLNGRIEKGELRNREGEVIQDGIDVGLVREDGALLYPIRGGIPVMLADEAISLASPEPSAQ